jgi:hypothetical protein
MAKHHQTELLRYSEIVENYSDKCHMVKFVDFFDGDFEFVPKSVVENINHTTKTIQIQSWWIEKKGIQ